jgi:tRNA G37 N-methylase TrmD
MEVRHGRKCDRSCGGEAVETWRASAGTFYPKNRRVVLMSRRAALMAAHAKFATIDHLIVWCDITKASINVVDHLVDDEYRSVIMSSLTSHRRRFYHAIVRLIPGVGVGQSAHVLCEGASTPAHARPDEFRGWRVPEILLGGLAAAIAWRRVRRSRKLRRYDRHGRKSSGF